MDLKNELLAIKNSSDETVFDSIDEAIKKQITALKAKRYLFSIIKMCNKIEKVLNDNEDKEFISRINFNIYLARHPVTTEIKLSSFVNFGFSNQENNIVPSHIHKSLKEIREITEEAPYFDLTSIGSLKHDLSLSNGVTIKLIDFRDKLMELLISKELIANLRCEELNLEIEQNKTNIPPKYKV